MSAARRRPAARIGLIGFGFIGEQVYRYIQSNPQQGLEIAFVHNRDRARLTPVPAELQLHELSAFAEREPDLVVEAAHPDFTRHWGEVVLGSCDYLPASVTALVDDALLARLVARAQAAGTRLLIPHGALIATENLVEWQSMWESVEITFRKNPDHIDFSESGIDPASIDLSAPESVIYDGSVRGIATRFPRNVNTMMTCAMATLGADRCRARLIAMPGAVTGTIELRALGKDGSLLTASKVQPMAGVSGTEMAQSTIGSILRAVGRGPSPGFV